MAKHLQMVRGTSAQNDTYTGLSGEITVDTTNKTIRVHDGSTAGGTALPSISQVNAKAPLASPTFTGTPKAPTASAGTNTTQVATTAFVTTAVANKTSVASATKATQDASGNVITSTYATKTEDSAKVVKSGSRGTLAGYNTPASTASAVTISQTSNDDTIVTGAVAITVSNGSASTAWVKNVAIQNASATVTLNSSWKWVGGSAPTITANSVLVLCWMGTFGLANLVSSS